MRQVKFFKGVEAELTNFQNEINEWLKQLQDGGGKVIDIRGNIAPQTVAVEKKAGLKSFSPSDLFAMVIYEPAP